MMMVMIVWLNNPPTKPGPYSTMAGAWSTPGNRYWKLWPNIVNISKAVQIFSCWSLSADAVGVVVFTSVGTVTQEILVKYIGSLSV